MTETATDWRAGLNAALLRLVQGDDESAREIVTWDEEIASTGTCETCDFDSIFVEITYRNDLGGEQRYTYRGAFSDLVNLL